ncbi:HIT domain-containing protein [Candidatus Babeliales bacterium]|nr:HIT domain-containing protein [Candidatus Babeliales bacterium]
MNSQDCIFCKIINKEISAKIIKENNTVIVIEDIFPKAPVHYLVIPKKHIVNLSTITSLDKELVWHMIEIIKELANDLPDPKAFNTLSNNGKEAGQSVFHMHWHFISGRNIVEGEF